jgi:hypothetical protein
MLSSNTAYLPICFVYILLTFHQHSLNRHLMLPFPDRLDLFLRAGSTLTRCNPFLGPRIAQPCQPLISYIRDRFSLIHLRAQICTS